MKKIKYTDLDISLEEWKKAIREVSEVMKTIERLQDYLYKIEKKRGPEDNDNVFRFRLRFDAENPLCKVHFPSSPVIPVSCLIEIARELANEITGKELKLTIAEDMLFYHYIDPVRIPVVEITLQLDDETPSLFKIDTSITDDTRVLATMKLNFIEK